MGKGEGQGDKYLGCITSRVVNEKEELYHRLQRDLFCFVMTLGRWTPWSFTKMGSLGSQNFIGGKKSCSVLIH